MTYETSNKTTRYGANGHYGREPYGREEAGDWRPAREPARPRTREIEARSILSDDREVVILHNDQRYVLRLTRLNKLILTK